MTRKDILKTLGYQETNEEGCTYEHPKFIWEDRFVYIGQTIEEILREHNEKVERRSISKAVNIVDKIHIFQLKS